MSAFARAAVLAILRRHKSPDSTGAISNRIAEALDGKLVIAEAVRGAERRVVQRTRDGRRRSAQGNRLRNAPVDGRRGCAAENMT